jgi:hypothetical protein
MNKEDLYALLGLGIGGLGGYFGQQALDKRRFAGQQSPLTFDQEKELAMIAAGIDPETGLPFGQKPDVQPVISSTYSGYGLEEGPSFTEQFTEGVIDPVVAAIDGRGPQELIEDIGYGGVPLDQLGIVKPVGNVDQDFYIPGMQTTSPASNIINRQLAEIGNEEIKDQMITNLGQTPTGDLFLQPSPSDVDQDFFIPQELLDANNPDIPDIIEFLGGDEALTPKGEQFYEDFLTNEGITNQIKQLGDAILPERFPIIGKRDFFERNIKDAIEKGDINVPKRMSEKEFINLALDVIGQESSYKLYGPDSSEGAIGPMQLMPGTFSRDPGFGLDPITMEQARDPLQNVNFGSNYLSGLLDYYTDEGYTMGQPQVYPDIQRALAAYNYGVGNIDADPMMTNLPTETINYLDALGYTLGDSPMGSIVQQGMNQGGRVGRQYGGGVDAGKDSPSDDKGLGAGVSSGVAQGLGGRPGGHDASKDDFGKENFGDPVGNDDSFGGDGSGPRPALSGVEEAETTPAFNPMVDMSSFYGPMYGEDTDVNANGIPDSQEFGPAPNEMGMTTDLGPLGTGLGINTNMGTMGIGADLGLGFGNTFGQDDQGTFGMGYNPMSGQVGMSATYGFNQGGRVGLDNGGSLTNDITELMNSLSMNMGDNQQMYQLSDADSFLRAEILGNDNPRYNYTLGSSLDSLMPGLSFEAGVMDDAVFGPGMTSPDDYKFFNLKKTF